jgi:hypothetical protein
MVNAPSEKQAAIESYFWDIFPFLRRTFQTQTSAQWPLRKRIGPSQVRHRLKSQPLVERVHLPSAPVDSPECIPYDDPD